MNDRTTQRIIEEVVASMDIPDSAYEKAENRYKDLGEWFRRSDAHCAAFDPHIYPQGSFRIGTVVRNDEYDLDFGCRLQTGILKTTHSQKQLKMLVRADLEAYREARGIKSALKEKPRCWRLPYADEMSFHMDGVPSIPERQETRQRLYESMIAAGSLDVLAQRVANHAGNITDNRLPNYEAIDPNWRISNSEGYALWFEAKMKLAMALLEQRAVAANKARVDDLPVRNWKSPLQKCVQVLKCHRNAMFADDLEGKPISIIITTLAALAYQGEQDVASALEQVLKTMGNYVSTTKPRIPNPVNPAEDFTDKWADPQYRHLNLEANFWQWLKQAQTDFKIIGASRDPDFIVEQVRTKFGMALNAESFKTKLGLGAVQILTTPKIHTITGTPPRPWMCG